MGGSFILPENRIPLLLICKSNNKRLTGLLVKLPVFKLKIYVLDSSMRGFTVMIKEEGNVENQDRPAGVSYSCLS